MDRYFKNKRTCEVVYTYSEAVEWLKENEYDVIEIWSYSDVIGEWICSAEFTFKGDI